MSIRDKINIDFFLNIKLLFKVKNLIPTYEVDKLTEMAEIMEECNPEAVILDIDQTLVPFGDTVIDDAIRHFLQRITIGKSFCLLSNVPRTEKRIQRIHSIEEQIGIKSVFSEKRKPAPEAFQAAMDYLRSKPSGTLMVGDRLFTDIVGANNVGIRTIMVSPLKPKTDPFIMVKLPRFFEEPCLKFARCLTKLRNKTKQRGENS